MSQTYANYEKIIDIELEPGNNLANYDDLDEPGDNLASNIWDKIQAIWQYLIQLIFIIDITRWLVRVGGNIAESAFTLATTYVIVNLVAHPLMLWMLGYNTSVLNTFNQIALICFSVLPELISVNAIIKSVSLWIMYVKARQETNTRQLALLFWSLAYSILTILFVAMTISTIVSFASSIDAMNRGITNITFNLDGNNVVIRCIAGWCFASLQNIFEARGKLPLVSLFDKLKSESTIKQAHIDRYMAENARLKNQCDIVGKERAELEQAIRDAKYAHATSKINKRKNDTSVAIIESSIPITPLPELNNDTEIDSNEQKRERLKNALLNAIVKGEKINLFQISQEANVSYGMVRKNASTMIEEVKEQAEHGIVMVPVE